MEKQLQSSVYYVSGMGFTKWAKWYKIIRCLNKLYLEILCSLYSLDLLTTGEIKKYFNKTYIGNQICGFYSVFVIKCKYFNADN